MESPLLVKLGGILLNNHNSIERLFTELYRYKSLNKRDIIIVNGATSSFGFFPQNFNQSTINSGSCLLNKLKDKKFLYSILPSISNIRLLAWAKKHNILGQSVFLPDFFSQLVGQADIFLNIEYFLKKIINRMSPYLNLIKDLLKNNTIPFICSMGLDSKGNIFNINSDIVVMILTIILKGNLILLTDVSSILNSKGERIKKISSHSAYNLIDSGFITNGMIIKVQSALVVSKYLKKSVEIASWHYENDFINLLQGKSIGTRIIE
ncbi:hypothetical protein [Buchnera aphidicola]|uniref:Acetylglutamate kinase n=1 Tax=Buchnera aphidicola (Cinara strobi) TaxID=1921549 RepID=A0A3B1DZY2_9GAMM|nr:hypothetical protein [Buchnera aphidicola]VAX76235.1 Acetylglutamate kinase [Buchnera aphidicola (Cinara strobi)]